MLGGAKAVDGAALHSMGEEGEVVAVVAGKGVAVAAGAGIATQVAGEAAIASDLALAIRVCSMHGPFP